MNKSIGLAMVVMALGGCAAVDENLGSEQDSFDIVQNQKGTLETTITSGGSSLRMLVVESDANVVDITFDFGGATLSAFHLDYNQGQGDFMPSGEAFDASQNLLVSNLLAELERALPADEASRSRVQETALRLTSYLQEAPVGELLTPFHFVAERGWAHISCGCANKNIGGYTRVAGTGCGCTGGSGNGCKGRCGSGCKSNCVSGAYTQDCAKHDYGLVSYSTAADDFSFASNNC